jgi:hypothetical protein
MRPYSPLTANPLNIEEQPPPQELTWDSPIRLIKSSYHLSDDLDNPDAPPRFIRMYADRWQVNWQSLEF